MNGSRVRGDTASRCRGPALLSGLLLIGILIVPSSITLGAQKRPMKIVDLINLPSLGDPQLSPDGELLLYTRSDADWELNGTATHIWRVRTDGSESVQLTNGEDGESSSRWSPDGTRIAFLALRHGNEQKQIWLIHNAGGEGSVLHRAPDGGLEHLVVARRSLDLLHRRGREDRAGESERESQRQRPRLRGRLAPSPSLEGGRRVGRHRAHHRGRLHRARL